MCSVSVIFFSVKYNTVDAFRKLFLVRARLFSRDLRQGRPREPCGEATVAATAVFLAATAAQGPRACLLRQTSWPPS